MPTTWADRVEWRWIKKVDVLNSTTYWLTGRGWLEAIRVSGLAEDPDLKVKLGRLAQALKDKVKEKGRREDAYSPGIWHPSFILLGSP